jgi:hypothetical protein
MLAEAMNSLTAWVRAVGDLPVGLPEALRRRDAAILAAPATLPIADPVERGENALAEFAYLGKDRFHDIRRSVGEPGQIGEALDMKDVIEQE